MRDTSNIKIVYIMPEHHGFFKSFDPLDRLELTVLPGAFALGAFDMADEDKDRIPVGLMVVTRSRKSLMCEWLAISKDYRGCGIGEDMLRMVFEVADQDGYETISAVFSGQIDESARNYFYQRFFKKEENMGKYLMSASEFVNDGKFCDTSMPGQCMSLAMAGSRVANEAAGFAKESDELHALSDGSILWNTADPDLTTIYTDGNKVRGVLVIIENDDIYTPVLLAADSEEIVDALIGSAVKSLKNRSLTDKEICVYVRDEYIRELMEDIIGSREPDRELVLSANVKDYAIYRDSLKDDKADGEYTNDDAADAILTDGLLDLEYYLRF